MLRREPVVGEVAGGIEAERAVLHEEAEAHAVLVEALRVVELRVEVAHLAVAAADLAVARDVGDGEGRVGGGVLAHGHLVDGADVELLHLEAVARHEVGVDLAHEDVAVGVAPLVGDGVVEIRPAAVEGRAELERVGRLHEAAHADLLSVPLARAGAPVLAAAVVGVVVGEHHVVDVGLRGVDARHVAGDPLAGVLRAVGEDPDGQLAARPGLVVAAVEEHRGAVGQDPEHALRHARVDEVHLELAGLPRRELLAREGMVLAAPGLAVAGRGRRRACFRRASAEGAEEGGERRRLHEIPSVHVFSFSLAEVF